MADWTDAEDDRLKELWPEKLSTAAIGRELHRSKNSVVGRAHRLELPSRPSPIVFGPPKPRPRPRAGPVTLPPLASTPRAVVRAPERSRPFGVAPDAVALPPAAARVAPVVEQRTATEGRVVECAWPIGEPGSAGFRFCNERSMPGRSYCAEHARIAYVRVRHREEDTAHG